MSDERQVFVKRNIAEILRLIDSKLHQDVPVVSSRQFLNALTELYLEELGIHNGEMKKRLLKHAIDSITQRSVAFEDQITSLRLALSRIFESEENWKQAAQVLMAIPLESGHRTVSARQKVDIYLHIVRLLLEDEEDQDHVGAEAYLNRAAAIIPDLNTPSDMELQMIFRVCQARILDLTRKFPESSQKYLELSRMLVDDAEQLHALSQSVITAVLSSNSSPLKHKVMLQLMADSRIVQSDSKLPQELKSILYAVANDRLIPVEQKRLFEKRLATHQLATLSDGVTTVFDRSVVEHNFLAISKLYQSISLDRLAKLLGLDDTMAAERVASTMFSDKRVCGVIDQAEGYVLFEQVATNENQLNFLLQTTNQICDLIIKG